MSLCFHLCDRVSWCPLPTSNEIGCSLPLSTLLACKISIKSSAISRAWNCPSWKEVGSLLQFGIAKLVVWCGAAGVWYGGMALGCRSSTVAVTMRGWVGIDVKLGSCQMAVAAGIGQGGVGTNWPAERPGWRQQTRCHRQSVEGWQEGHRCRSCEWVTDT